MSDPYPVRSVFWRHWRQCRALVLILMGLLLSACDQPPRLSSLSGPAQGTTWHVTFWKAGGVTSSSVQDGIVEELARIDALMSNYRPDSAIERFNRAEASAPTAVGEEVVDLIAKAKTVSEASLGCYDLTIKPLFDLWGFSGQQLSVPSEVELQRRLDEVGMEFLVPRSNGGLSKSRSDLQVDLSSIAQGYTVEKMAGVLESAGIEHYLVELGGEMKVRGHKPGGEPWRVAIERPTPGERSVHKVITIARDAPISVMTSGTYRHYFDDQGRRYSHVLDARTGRPVNHDTVSVTVLEQDPSLADAWSTALLCLGATDGRAVADRHGIAALFIEEVEGKLSEVTTRQWREMSGIEID